MDPPTLVLLHGYPFDHTFWASVRATLPCDVYCPDLRWVSSPQTLPEEPALEILADEVAARLQERGGSRAIVAGFSMGGYVALALAERHPSQLGGLALINSQTIADSDEARSNRRALIQKIRKGGEQVALEAVLPKMFVHPSPELTAYARRAAARAGPRGLCWALESMARRPDRTSVFGSFLEPTLVLHGAQDQIVPVEQARHLAASRSGTLYRELAGSGHASPLEDPKGVSAAFQELLELSAKG